jgi:3D (Asp-Asp-Asp) domain-containing protein
MKKGGNWMIKTSVKFSILSILLFVLINVFYIQPETRAYSNVQADQITVEATPAKPVMATEEAILTPAVEIPLAVDSTVAVNKTSEATADTIVTTAPAADKTETLMMMGAFRATAYCLKGRTATGGGVRRGIVAADPRVLPLGSRIQIDAGAYSGTYTVADTGGAIRGRILDIWVPSCSEANRFGRRTIHVTKMGGRQAK